MLHFVQHDSEASSKILLGNDINDYTNCHSERQRRIFIVKMLHFVQHDSEASSKILLGNDINDYTNCHSEPSALSGAEGAVKNLYCKDASLR